MSAGRWSTNLRWPHCGHQGATAGAGPHLHRHRLCHAEAQVIHAQRDGEASAVIVAHRCSLGAQGISPRAAAAHGARPAFSSRERQKAAAPRPSSTAWPKIRGKGSQLLEPCETEPTPSRERFKDVEESRVTRLGTPARDGWHHALRLHAQEGRRVHGVAEAVV